MTGAQAQIRMGEYGVLCIRLKETSDSRDYFVRGTSRSTKSFCFCWGVTWLGSHGAERQRYGPNQQRGGELKIIVKTCAGPKAVVVTGYRRPWVGGGVGVGGRWGD